MVDMIGEEMGCRGEGFGAGKRNLTYLLLSFIVDYNLPLMYFRSGLIWR